MRLRLNDIFILKDGLIKWKLQYQGKVVSLYSHLFIEISLIRSLKATVQQSKKENFITVQPLTFPPVVLF